MEMGTLKTTKFSSLILHPVTPIQRGPVPEDKRQYKKRRFLWL